MIDAQSYECLRGTLQQKKEEVLKQMKPLEPNPLTCRRSLLGVVRISQLAPNLRRFGMPIQQLRVSKLPTAQPKSNAPGAPMRAAMKPTSVAPTLLAPWENM